MYEPYPVSEPPQESQAPPPAPPGSVINAVRLMYAGAALELIGAIIALATVGSLKTAILAKHPHYTTAQLHSAQNITVAGTVIGGLIAIGLWLWMAWANRRGRKWARVVS